MLQSQEKIVEAENLLCQATFKSTKASRNLLKKISKDIFIAYVPSSPTKMGCSTCANYSHADCYNVVDINIKHICGSCAIKDDVNCTNEKVKKFMEKEDKTQKDHSKFAFNLMLRRVMSSILKEE